MLPTDGHSLIKSKLLHDSWDCFFLVLDKTFITSLSKPLCLSLVLWFSNFFSKIAKSHNCFHRPCINWWKAIRTFAFGCKQSLKYYSRMLQIVVNWHNCFCGWCCQWNLLWRKCNYKVKTGIWVLLCVVVGIYFYL